MAGVVGLEPTTVGSKGRGSTTELHPSKNCLLPTPVIIGGSKSVKALLCIHGRFRNSFCASEQIGLAPSQQTKINRGDRIRTDDGQLPKLVPDQARQRPVYIGRSEWI